MSYKLDPNLTDDQQIAAQNAIIKSTLWQVAALLLLVGLAIFKGYALHVQEQIGTAESEVALKQELLDACRSSSAQPAPSCKGREDELAEANRSLAGLKGSGFNALALGVFGSTPEAAPQ